MNSTNFFEEAMSELDIDERKGDDFALILLEVLDEPINFYLLKNALKTKKT